MPVDLGLITATACTQIGGQNAWKLQAFAMLQCGCLQGQARCIVHGTSLTLSSPRQASAPVAPPAGSTPTVLGCSA
jgi:hypothetical protein